MIRILYVDDEEVLLDICKSFLEQSCDLTVDIFKSVAEAEERLSSTHYDAIISDYQMAEISGIDFLKRLRSQGNRIPFILFTGKGREEVVIDALNNGADFYLQKGGEPVSQFRELEHKVREAVQRREVEEAVKRSNLRLKVAMDLTHISNWTLDLRSSIFEVDDALWAILGTDSIMENGNEISVDKYLSDFVHPEDRHKLFSNLDTYNSATGPVALQNEYRVVRRDGLVRHVIVTSSLILDQDSKPRMLFGALQDVTEQKDREELLARLNRELLAIKQINQLIVHARTEKELLDQTCYIACEIGGYRLAWIGFLENDEKRSVRPVAWAGSDESYVLDANVSWDDNERGRGPTGVAARTGRTTYVQDWENESSVSPWRPSAQKRGYKSSICLPIRFQSNVIGVLSLYSSAINGFTPDEVHMLEEMVGDLSFGITSLRGENEKKNAEEELLKKTALFEAQAAASLDGILVIGPDQKRIMINQRVIELFHPPKYVLDNPDNEMLLLNHVIGLVKDPETVLQKVLYLNKHINETIMDEVEFKNGMVLERYSAPVFGKDGRYYGRTWIFHDVTGRKHAEASLKESEEKFRNIFDSTNDGTYIIGQDGQFFEVNQTFSERLGYSKDEMRKMGLIHIVSPEYQGKISGRLKETKDVGHLIFESVHIARDGRHIPVEVNTRPINYQGKLAYLGVARDITERIQIKEELLRKNEEIEAFFDLGLDLLGILDKKGNFIRTNKGWEVALCYTQDEFKTKKIWDIVHPDDIGTTRASAIALSEQNPAVNFVNRCRKSDGSYRWIEWYASPKDDLVYTAARDITDKKQIQDALAEAGRKLKILSSMTRHDISNLVMGQLGYLDLRAIKHPEQASDEHIRQVENAARSIKSIIQFTKVYEEIGVKAPEWQDLKGTIDQSLAAVQLGSVRAINDVPAGTQVFADLLISKVFYNLAQNAVRHGGRIASIHIFTEESNDRHLIVCQDDGPGISDDVRPKLFTKWEGEEHGYGLYLSKEILAITGISIRENGRPGQGARFEISVPKKNWRTGQ